MKRNLRIRNLYVCLVIFLYSSVKEEKKRYLRTLALGAETVSVSLNDAFGTMISFRSQHGRENWKGKAVFPTCTRGCPEYGELVPPRAPRSPESLSPSSKLVNIQHDSSNRKLVKLFNVFLKSVFQHDQTAP